MWLRCFAGPGADSCFLYLVQRTAWLESGTSSSRVLRGGGGVESAVSDSEEFASRV
jgi:hypothetical protein